MKLPQIALTFTLAFVSVFTSVTTLADTAGSNVSTTTATTIADPYSDDQANSPWTQSMENVTTFGGRVVRGSATMVEGAKKNFDTYTPYFADKTQALSGYGSSKVSVGCDGVNLGGIIDGQLAQYQQMIEEFIQKAPALAIMYLAYSQPTVKAVIDELNNVGQFGLDLTNMSCSGVRAIADKAAEEKAQAMAEARCTAEAGFKDPECMSDDGLLSSVASVMKDAKNTVTERTSQYLGKVGSATGGLVQFRTGLNGQTTTSSGSSGTGTGSSTNNGVRTKACTKINSEGLRTMLLASSGIPCDDIENYGPLLPDYKIADSGESGVIPRTMTIRKLASDLVVKYEAWVNEVMGAPESEFINTDGFKAIYNRTSVAISTEQHRKMNLLMQQNPAQGLTVIRNMSQLIALKDLTNIVNNLEVAVLTGIQNQPDDEVLSDLRKKQYVHAIDSLKAELNNLTDEVTMDLARKELFQSN